MVNFWGETEFDDGHQWYSILRGIFETALISLVAVFLLQHDSHESHLATFVNPPQSKAQKPKEYLNFLILFIECFR